MHGHCCLSGTVIEGGREQDSREERISMRVWVDVGPNAGRSFITFCLPFTVFYPGIAH